jgi:hypothetical protein
MTSTNNINTDNLVNSLYANKGKLDDKVAGTNFVGGFHLGPIGIPNQFLGLDMRTSGQKEAQAAPQQYEVAMRKLLDSLTQALDAAASPYPNQNA